jgi:hypothetical protein
MTIILGKIKCCFCGKKNGVFHSVHGYGIYEMDVGKRLFYHPECLEMVEIDPEKYSHNWADKAIQINELFKKNRVRCNSTLVTEYKRKVEKLHANHFERMMPRKSK